MVHRSQYSVTVDKDTEKLNFANSKISRNRMSILLPSTYDYDTN